MNSSSQLRCAQISTQSFSIITQYGDMQVIKQGAHVGSCQQSDQLLSQSRPVIMTFHDIGLNSELQFSKFCEYDDVKLMMQTFNLVHVNFIGQEFVSAHASQPGQLACQDLAEDFKYPSVEQLAECIVDVCAQLRLRSFIALAVGAGAHVVSLLALRRPDLVDGLFLINPVVSSCSITEWLYFKMSAIGQHHHSSGQPACESGQSVSPKRDSNIRRLLNAVHLSPAASRANQDEPAAGKANSADTEETKSLGQLSTSSAAEPSRAPHSGSRLRRLILSRNFRLGQHHLQRQSSGLGQEAAGQRKPVAPAECESADSPSQQSPRQCQLQRRPPVEYLMYHHFGPNSFQRHRRSSDTPTPSSDSNSSSPQRSLADSAESRLARLGASRSQSRSHDSLACPPAEPGRSERGSAGTPTMSSPPRSRTESVSLSVSQLASLSERQRLAYVQAVYRHHFGRLNAHNLWLLAQSFARRKALSLRKDCGAAAHAAAAAAALGTSICTAFVGVAPVGAERTAGAGPEPAGGQQDELAKQQAQVAGTKVKRTFTCQTLIMCSSVQLHCERAFKLMSLLNPLQATCIKTDQLLVLEERPDKVCQALRLFLQGIGYSMSTYERRLRLSSTQGSASSADSASSARSLASEC